MPAPRRHWLFTPLHLTRRARLWLALAALALVATSLVLASSRWLGAARIDLTTDRLYTLTPGTLDIVEQLHRPLRLTLYFSQHATRGLPQLRSYQQRVREMLQEMVAHSRGKLRLVIIDPVPYSNDEAGAEGAGLTALSGGSNGERVFFGLAGSAMPAGDIDSDDRLPERTQAIAFFDPARENFLEYDVARLLYELDQPAKPAIGILSSLPVAGNALRSELPWATIQQLGQQFELRMLDAGSLVKVAADLRALLVIHPKRLSDDAQYALDQYVLGGGHVAIFVDPDAELDASPYAPDSLTFPDHASDLPRLFQAWGLRYDPRQVVLDRSRALSIELDGASLNHPAMLDLGSHELNRNDAITASIPRVNISTAGHFDLAPDTANRLVPLMQSTPEAELTQTQHVLDAAANPLGLLDGYQPDGARYVFAARLRGKLASAFPERAATPGHIASAPSGAEVVLVADTDLLSDRLWVEPQVILGQTMMQPFANNGDFLLNLADNLTGSSALLSIRARSTSQRPFTRVEALRAEADQKFLQKERELEQELADTRRRLAELQPAKAGRGAAPSAEQRREIEQFRQRQLDINRALRDVQHQLNAEIDALGARVKAIDIVLMPALVTLAGLLYGIWRTRRGRRRR